MNGPRLGIVGIQSWAGLTWHPILVLQVKGTRVVAVHEDTCLRWRRGQKAHRLPLEAVRFVEGPLTLEQYGTLGTP